MENSPIEHSCSAKQSLDELSNIDHEGADGKECKSMPALDTIETMPSLSDLPPMLSGIPATKYPDDHGWDGADPPLVEDPDEMGEIDEHEIFLASESSSGRRCDISYPECHDDMLSDPDRSGWNDPLLSEWPPEPFSPKKFPFLGGRKQNTVCNEVGKVHKQACEFGTKSSGDKEKVTVFFCNRLLRVTKKKQDEEKDEELQLLAEVSIMTQIAQHADQAQDFFTSSLKGFDQQFSAGPSFGCKVSRPANDLNFDHGSGRPVTKPLSSHSKSPTFEHRPADLSIPDEAAEMDEFWQNLQGKGENHKEQAQFASYKKWCGNTNA